MTMRNWPAQRFLLQSARIIDMNGQLSQEVLVEDGTIVALGVKAAECAASLPGVRRIDLNGATVTAGFVDAHVHLTSTGLLMSGLDLRGVRHRSHILDCLREFARACDDDIIIGHGWDDALFEDRLLPTPFELDDASGGRPVYLTRIDVHSALVSQTLLDRVPAISGDVGYVEAMPVSQAAHGRVRTHALTALTQRQLSAAQLAALRRASSCGVVSVHENGGPVVSSARDLISALTLGSQSGNPEVIGYWGELFGAERARELGAHGVAGDLFIDGSLGSHTAHLCHDYADRASRGACYISEPELSEHFADCVRRGLQAGVHAIGDAAIDLTLRAMADCGGRSPLGWRIEHMEMPQPEHIALAAQLGVIASVQPQFDALWGGEHGMYAQRLGVGRARRMNPFASLVAAGVHVAFGSDSPVTPIDPWATVAAAINHYESDERLAPIAALAAATHGAADAAPAADETAPDRETSVTAEQRRVRSRLAPGEPADLAIWATTNPVGVYADAQSEIAALATSRPQALATLRSGEIIFDSGLFI